MGRATSADPVGVAPPGRRPGPQRRCDITATQDPIAPIAPPGPAPKKRRWFLRKRVLIPVAAFVVLGIAASASSSSKKDEGSATTQTTIAEAQDSTATTAVATTDAIAAAPAATEPTAAPVVAEDPTTTQAPATTAAPAPVTSLGSFSGTGDDVVAAPESKDLMTAAITHDGSSNFAIQLVDANGQLTGLLVNEIGAYQGTVAVKDLIGEGVEAGSMLKVTADGNWSIEFRPVAAQPTWHGEAASGAGDEVLYVGKLDKPAKVTITHDGASNFAVFAHTDGIISMDLLVNEIGTYSGTVLVPKDTLVIEITADGPWSITPA
jgi:hypothetical protein